MDQHELSNETDRHSSDRETLSHEDSPANDAAETEVSDSSEQRVSEKQAEGKDASAKAKSYKRLVVGIMTIVTLIILFTNVNSLRQSAINTATNVHNWAESTFYYEMKKSSEGCTVDIVDVNVANDFLYLTVNESYRKKTISKSEETWEYVLPDLHYSGSIYNSLGESVEFDNSNFIYLQYENSKYPDYSIRCSDRTIVGMDDDGYKKSGKFTVHAEYKIYVPGLTSLLSDETEKYACALNVSSEKTGSDMDLSFGIYHIDDVINAKTYFLNHWVDIDEVTFVFQQMQISSRGMDVIIEWDPLTTADYEPDVGATLRVTKTGVEENEVVLTSYSEGESEAQDKLLNSRPYLVVEGKHYLILSDNSAEYEFLDADVTVQITELHCDYSGLIQHRYDLDDIVLNSTPVSEVQNQLNQKITIGDVQIQLHSLNMLKPEENYIQGYLDYGYSYLGFDGSLEYTGEGNLVHWQGYMELFNPDTNQTAKFCIQYYNMPEGYGSGFHIENGLLIQSYYLADPVTFLKNFSGWHVVSITEVTADTYEESAEKFDRVTYQNRWTNPAYADVRVNGLHGRKYIYFSFVVPKS